MGTKSSERNLRRGFTLVEVLAVVVIIASLASMIFPVFSVAKSKSKSTVCLSNLHQIGVATGLYLADYEDHYPLCVNFVERIATEVRFGRPLGSNPSDYLTPRESLIQYVKEVQTFRCPVDFGAAIGQNQRFFPRLYEKNDETSYLFAGLFDNQTGTSWQDPSNSIWACDGSVQWHSLNYNPYDFSTHAINAVFYDVHVKFTRNRNAPTWLE
jgi:prepilin-type N-terminal cleavage/methylation domain-containing protein